MTITLCNQKGGTGKTTLSILLAYTFANAGYSVGLLDRDPQGTATQWITSNQVNGLEIFNQGIEYDIVIIDTPPHGQSRELIQAIKAADVILLATSPSPADLWSSQNTVDVINEHKRPKAKARLLFNMVQNHTVLSRELGRMAKALKIKALKGHVSRWQCYQHAATLGYKALHTKARGELLSLAVEISKLK
jgi:chromosome partitioning protein